MQGHHYEVGLASDESTSSSKVTPGSSIAADVVAAVVDVLATDAPQLVPPYVRGLQYLDPPSMIQTGLIPLHPGAVRAYQELHG